MRGQRVMTSAQMKASTSSYMKNRLKGVFHMALMEKCMRPGEAASIFPPLLSGGRESVWKRMLNIQEHRHHEKM